MMLEAASISERSAQQTGAYVVEMPKAGRRGGELKRAEPVRRHGIEDDRPGQFTS